MPAQHTVRNLNAVSQTLLIPLYFRAMESQRPDALIRDPRQWSWSASSIMISPASRG